MPIVFLVAAAAATVYFLRLRRRETAPSTSGGFWPASQVRPALVGISGWLLVYVVCLAIELAHGLALTIGSVVIYSKPSLAGLHSFIPLWALLIYVISNLGLVAYGVALFALMSRARKAAITHNIVFNASVHRLPAYMVLPQCEVSVGNDRRLASWSARHRVFCPAREECGIRLRQPAHLRAAPDCSRPAVPPERGSPPIPYHRLRVALSTNRFGPCSRPANCH